MQIRTGSCNVENGSAVVIASEGNDWTEVAANCLFSVPATDGTSVLYTVASTVAPGVSVSERWEINLTANYAGPDAEAVAYCIHKDFTGSLNLPIIKYGDTNTAILINRALQLLEASVFGVVASADALPFLGTFDGPTVASGATHVDSLDTTALTTGKIYAYNHATEGVKFLALNAGTAATALPGTFRPLDYNAGTNAKYWTTR